MLLKWIVCDVGEEARASFSAAQEGWGKLASAPGFLGQIGGWDTRSENTACIISLWRDLTSYEFFMGRLHHEIVAESEQSQTYRSISVTLFGDMIPMPGSRGMILDALEEGKLIRVADCTLKKGREGHFLEMQRDSWIPGMGKAEGMLGGMFWRVRDGGDRYLVTTVWQDRTSHLAYIDNIFPGLRARAAVEAMWEPSGATSSRWKAPGGSLPRAAERSVRPSQASSSIIAFRHSHPSVRRRKSA